MKIQTEQMFLDGEGRRMKREIIFENENARLLFEPIRDHFPKLDFNDEEELTEEAALRMYRSVTRSKRSLSKQGILSHTKWLT